ncbi:hypothetical protein BHM03_00003441 [Ensete ventricosum]|uniref:Ethylene insensitive 3-like DNA-binding domain-containing protein n=1 Tax=Ensete ventricosum TaxID=4639 RepID=A0A427A5C0_ENSVE|nr:hypothetical protein B296_00028117 [Ensete ventricosum]RZR71093.1 hypothetical protein BHM03_00003441 [Ensete ventricosum]
MDHIMMIEDLGGDALDFEVDGAKYDNLIENDVSDEEIEPNELARRMWKDRVKLKRIKEREKLAAQQAASEMSKPRQISDQALRKKMSRAQDGILKYMLKLMEVCNVRGFVYGIIPEKGKPHREETNSSSDEYDVDGCEDARGSTLCRDGERNLQVQTQDCAENIASTSKEDSPTEIINQLDQIKEQTSERPKRKRPRVSAVSSDKRTAPTQNEHIPGETTHARSDMNGTSMSRLIRHTPSVRNKTYLNPNPKHQERDLRSECLALQSGISNLESFHSVNVATEKIGVGDQPLVYPGVGNNELQYATTIDNEANCEFYNSSGGFSILQDKQQHPISVTSHGIRSDNSGNRVENNTYDYLTTPNVNSHTGFGDMHLFIDEPFYTEQDKFAGNSFGLPLDFIGISSPTSIPDLGDILHDDDLMEYLGT